MASELDALTQLASKTQLVQWLDRAVPGAALALIDLDDFRLLNQSLGHDLGDETLRLVARRLEAAFAAPAFGVARLSQDEFAVLSYEIDTPSQAFADAIVGVFRDPYRVDTRTVRVRATCGIARCGPLKSPNDVIREADTAMYEAKSQAKGASLVFDESFHQRAAEAFEIVEGLRDALAHGALRIHYQAELDLAGGRVTGAEALVRWNHPTMGSLAPETFIPVAEASGLIGELGQFMLHGALSQRRSWVDANVVDESFCIAVNVSPRQLDEPTLVASVAAALEMHGCPPDRLCLELTESAVMADPIGATRTLEQLADLGLQLAIDDFGTGHSSLSYLQQLPITALKIDRSFVARSHEHRGRSLIIAILAIARALDLTTIAEGIETDEQRRLLTDLGCELGQGFLFARPVAPNEFAVALATAGDLLPLR